MEEALGMETKKELKKLKVISIILSSLISVVGLQFQVMVATQLRIIVR
jgi:hypothetical protein